jgi:hypothetical protein
MLEIQPTYSLATYRNTYAVMWEERFTGLIEDGLRLAGVPEG